MHTRIWEWGSVGCLHVARPSLDSPIPTPVLMHHNPLQATSTTIIKMEQCNTSNNCTAGTHRLDTLHCAAFHRKLCPWRISTHSFRSRVSEMLGSFCAQLWQHEKYQTFPSNMRLKELYCESSDTKGVRTKQRKDKLMYHWRKTVIYLVYVCSLPSVQP